jgi:hypothetical protein
MSRGWASYVALTLSPFFFLSFEESSLIPYFSMLARGLVHVYLKVHIHNWACGDFNEQPAKAVSRTLFRMWGRCLIQALSEIVRGKILAYDEYARSLQ